MGIVYEKVMQSLNNSSTVAFRVKKHAEAAERSLLPGEKVIGAYAGYSLGMLKTYVIVITDRRIICAHKNLLIGELVESLNKDKVCQVDNKKGLFYSGLSIKTYHSVFASIGFLDSKTAANMKEDIIQSTIVSTVNEKERESVRPIKRKQYTQKQTKSLDLEKQLEMCKQIDKLYREKLASTSDPIERSEIKKKLWDNYYLYKELKGETPTEKPQSLLLK